MSLELRRAWIRGTYPYDGADQDVAIALSGVPDTRASNDDASGEAAR